MSLGTSNRDGGKTSESGHLRALAKMVSGDVLEGLNVSQRGAGANMSVDIAVGDAFVRRSDGSYAHPVFNDAVYNQVISAADGSNPRRDIVVIYVDYGQSPSTAVSNNTNGVVKIKVVNGTPAGSPVDPNDAAIQSSVGAGNPFTKLARVRVPAGQTSITNSLIDDLRSLITSKSATVNTAAIQDAGVTTAKIGDTQVTKSKLSFDSGIWWEELARATASSTQADLETATFTTRKYLKIIFTGLASGGTYAFGLQFNGDTGNNYADSLIYQSPPSSVGMVKGGPQNRIRASTTVISSGVFYFEAEILNVPGWTKLVQGHQTGEIGGLDATNGPDNQFFSGKWLNFAGGINKIKIIKTGGTSGMSIGSEIIVLGHN